MALVMRRGGRHMMLSTLVVYLRHVSAGHLGLAADLALPSVHATIPPVLDCIVAASRKPSRNLGPPLSHLADQPLNLTAFLHRDGIVDERRLEVLVESLPALLGRSGSDEVGDADPVVGPALAHQLDEVVVLGLGPRAALVVWHLAVGGWQLRLIGRYGHVVLHFISTVLI